MLTKNSYLHYQKQLANSQVVRYFWQFWSNYSFVFFIAAVILILSNTTMQPFSRPVLVLAILAFLIGRGVFVTMINIFYARKRPYQEFGFAPLTSKFFSFRTTFPNSFPSRHSTAYFAIACVISLFFPALGAALIAVSIMAALGRIVLGFHWPSDVIAGAILGIIVGYLTVLIGYPILFT